MDAMALTKNMTYGLYVISVFDEANGRPGGFIIDAAAQISSDEEPVFVFSVMNRNYSKDCIDRQGVFNVSVLTEDVAPFTIGNFGFQSSKDVSKWDNVPHTLQSGLPVLDGAAAWAQMRVLDKRVMGTHTAFFCTPTAAEALEQDKPLLRYADYFTKLKDKVMAAFNEWKQQAES